MKKISELERAKKEITELKRHFLMKRREEFSADLRAKQQFLEFTDGDLRLKNENLIFEQILTLIKGSNKKNGKTTLQLDKYEDDTCLPQYRVKDIHGEVLAYFSFEDQRNDLLYLINQLDVLEEFVFIDSEGRVISNYRKFNAFDFLVSNLSQALSIYTSAKHNLKTRVVIDEEEGKELCKLIFSDTSKILSIRISHFIHYIGLLSKEIKMKIKGDLRVPSLNLELVGRIEKDSEEKIIVVEINKI